MIHVCNSNIFRIDLVSIFGTKNIDLFFVAEELKAYWEKLERERRQNEALSSKLADMEATALRRETDISDLKRLLQLVKEEHVQILQVNNTNEHLVYSTFLNLAHVLFPLPARSGTGGPEESRSTCHR